VRQSDARKFVLELAYCVGLNAPDLVCVHVRVCFVYV